MLTLRSLHYFMALVQERHFGRAAARVNISQPALSMQIKELERALNVAFWSRWLHLNNWPAVAGWKRA
jgi:LysR family transcriptional regulator, hydrogen peroxide-inducible genes activator